MTRFVVADDGHGDIRPLAHLGRLPRKGKPRGSVYPIADRLSRMLLEDAETGCWVWQGALNKSGYASIYTGADGDWPKGNVHAHRVAWVLTNGPIPLGLTVDHLCFNPPCANPAHLRLLSNAENSANKLSQFWTHCRNGHEKAPANQLGNGDCRQCDRDRGKRYDESRAGTWPELACEFCGSVVQKRGLRKHMLRRHSDLLGSAA